MVEYVAGGDGHCYYLYAVMCLCKDAIFPLVIYTHFSSPPSSQSYYSRFQAQSHSHLPPTQLLRNPLHPLLIDTISHGTAPLRRRSGLLPGACTCRVVLQQRRDGDGRFAIPNIRTARGGRGPLGLRSVEDTVDLHGQLFLRGDEGARVHVEGVQGVAARFGFRCCVGGHVGEFATVDCCAGGWIGVRRGGARCEVQVGCDGGVGQALVFAWRLRHQPGALVLACGGSRGHLPGHHLLAVVEFEEAGAEVLPAEVGHARFVFFLFGHLAERFAWCLFTHGNGAG